MNNKLVILILIVAFIWGVSAEKKARTAPPTPTPAPVVTPTATQTPPVHTAPTAVPEISEPPTKTPPPLPTAMATAVPPYPVGTALPTLEAYP